MLTKAEIDSGISLPYRRTFDEPQSIRADGRIGVAFHPVFFRLTEAGRALRWSEWRKLGGSGLTMHGTAETQGLFHRGADPTMGEIADASPGQGRSDARFAYQRLGRHDLAEPYRYENEIKEWKHRGELPAATASIMEAA